MECKWNAAHRYEQVHTSGATAADDSEACWSSGSERFARPECPAHIGHDATISLSAKAKLF
jgi:hypothetical protein